MNHIPKEIVEWIVGDDSGSSSKAIVFSFYDIKSRDRWSYPLDRWDFGRCVRMLQKFPHITVEHMKSVNAVWKGLAENWDMLVKAWHETEEKSKTEWHVSDEEVKAHFPKARKFADHYYKCQKEIRDKKLRKVYKDFSDLIDNIRKSVDEAPILKQNNTVIIDMDRLNL